MSSESSAEFLWRVVLTADWAIFDPSNLGKGMEGGRGQVLKMVAN